MTADADLGSEPLSLTVTVTSYWPGGNDRAGGPVRRPVWASSCSPSGEPEPRAEVGVGAGFVVVVAACRIALCLFRVSLVYFCPVLKVFGGLSCLLPTYVFTLSCQGLILERCSYGARSVTQLGHFGFTLFLCQAVSRGVRYACGWFPSFVLRLGCQGFQLCFAVMVWGQCRNGSMG